MRSHQIPVENSQQANRTDLLLFHSRNGSTGQKVTKIYYASKELKKFLNRGIYSKI